MSTLSNSKAGVDHSPLPWIANADGEIGFVIPQRYCDTFSVVARARIPMAHDESQSYADRRDVIRPANIAFILRACNSYYRMIDAMEAARKEIMWWADQDGEPHESEAIRLIDAVLQSHKEPNP